MAVVFVALILLFVFGAIGVWIYLTFWSIGMWRKRRAEERVAASRLHQAEVQRKVNLL